MIATLVHGSELETVKEAPLLTITRVLYSEICDIPRNCFRRLISRGCYELCDGLLCRRNLSVNVARECDLKVTSFLCGMLVYQARIRLNKRRQTCMAF